MPTCWKRNTRAGASSRRHRRRSHIHPRDARAFAMDSLRILIADDESIRLLSLRAQFGRARTPGGG